MSNFQPGDRVFATQDLFNDPLEETGESGIPGFNPGDLLAPAGTRGMVVNVGHVEAAPEDEIYPGPVNPNFAPALPRESDGCKAWRTGKGHPLPNVTTQQTRFLAATRRGGPIRAHPFVASRLQYPHCGASRFAGGIPNRPRRRREIRVDRPARFETGLNGQLAEPIGCLASELSYGLAAT